MQQAAGKLEELRRDEEQRQEIMADTLSRVFNPATEPLGAKLESAGLFTEVQLEGIKRFVPGKAYKIVEIDPATNEAVIDPATGKPKTKEVDGSALRDDAVKIKAFQIRNKVDDTGKDKAGTQIVPKELLPEINEKLYGTKTPEREATGEIKSDEELKAIKKLKESLQELKGQKMAVGESTKHLDKALVNADELESAHKDNNLAKAIGDAKEIKATKEKIEAKKEKLDAILDSELNDILGSSKQEQQQQTPSQQPERYASQAADMSTVSAPKLPTNNQMAAKPSGMAQSVKSGYRS